MNYKTSVKSIGLQNFLSYGPRSIEIEFGSLNVLIGPNASGKSNFIEALQVLQALPHDLPKAISRSGGIHSLLWKGTSGGNVAELQVAVHNSELGVTYRHLIGLCEVAPRLEIAAETITQLDSQGKELSFYLNNGSQHFIRVQTESDEKVQRPGISLVRKVSPDGFKREYSILAQRSDPDQFPVLTKLSDIYKGFRIYSDLSVARGTPIRMPQPTDLEADFLSSNAENLALVLSSLMNNPVVKQRILKELRRFVERASDIIVHVSYGTAQLYLEEEGLRANIPATRISDGTLRYLCLLAILCHPSPPPLICIEEPEVGLHPDMIRSVAELLIDASTSTQLVITTHSDLLVSALSEVPEAIIVCERDENGTQLKRLDPEMMREWLERYTLGELWLKGEIGGTRW
ncbi:MAG: AAA family ATPase [Armatimonadota bacterium]|nr:AAA family ATPase [Armatimonadota bacterium]